MDVIDVIVYETNNFNRAVLTITSWVCLHMRGLVCMCIYVKGVGVPFKKNLLKENYSPLLAIPLMLEGVGSDNDGQVWVEMATKITCQVILLAFVYCL